MTNNKSKIGWGFWSLWVILIAVFFLIGWFLGYLQGKYYASMLINNYVNEVLAEVIYFCISGAILGALVGLIQWIILQRKVSLSALWILASIAGLSASGLVAGLVSWIFSYSRNIGFDILSTVLIYTVGGTLIGLLQWPILRRKVTRAGWWVLASTLGWGLSPVFWELMSIRVKLWTPLSQSGSIFIGGLMLGTVTGVALSLLLRREMEKT